MSFRLVNRLLFAGRHSARGLRQLSVASRIGSRNFRVLGGAAGVAIAFAGASTIIAFNDSPAVTETATGISFAKDLPLDTGYDIPERTLLGVGCRYKYGWVKVHISFSISHEGLCCRSLCDSGRVEEPARC
jgi:hypothetical protein